MPNTRASTSRLVSKRKSRREDGAASSDDDFLAVGQNAQKDVETETDSIVENLRGAISGVRKVHTQIRSLEQENQRLRTELREARRNISRDERTSASSRGKAASSRRRNQSLERRITDLEAAREKDRRIIEKLRNAEIQQDAQDLEIDQPGTAYTQQSGDLGESAIKLLRRMCDTVDMNTLAEGEDCAVCLEEMEVGKCYSLPCRHPICVQCFDQLGDGSNMPSNGRTGVQCPHCREIYPRTECEIITHNAVQQWDLLLEISQEWSTKDVGEIDMGEDEDDSSVDDGSVAAATSTHPPDSPEVADLDPDVSTELTPHNDDGRLAYNNLPSPMKRQRLMELAVQRTARERM